MKGMGSMKEDSRMKDDNNDDNNNDNDMPPSHMSRMRKPSMDEVILIAYDDYFKYLSVKKVDINHSRQKCESVKILVTRQ